MHGLESIDGRLMASLPRVYVGPQAAPHSAVTVKDRRARHHLMDVLRLQEGDRIECLDGQGGVFEGRLARAGPEGVEIELGGALKARVPSLDLVLAQGVLKGNRFDWVVQKATELGVSRLCPLITRRTIVRGSPAGGLTKSARWRRIALEAVKQCGRSTVPSVDPPQSLEAFLPQARRANLILMPTLCVATKPIREVLQAHGGVRDVVVLIGPEGDFTQEEVALAQSYGAQPVSLGAAILRGETASLAALAILSYALGR